MCIPPRSLIGLPRSLSSLSLQVLGPLSLNLLSSLLSSPDFLHASYRGPGDPGRRGCGSGVRRLRSSFSRSRISSLIEAALGLVPPLGGGGIISGFGGKPAIGAEQESYCGRRRQLSRLSPAIIGFPSWFNVHAAVPVSIS